MKVGLFIPCYVDAVYPKVGMATYRLLRHLGVDITYPEKQTCCGQPMANAGFDNKSVSLAKKFIDRFEGFDYIVTPSVSCTAFIRLSYPGLIPGEHTCEGITVVEPERPDECCGFGGMFSVEELAVSRQMGMAKLQRHIDTGAEFITGADCSCLMHMAGIAAKEGRKIEFKHVMEILAEGL